MEKAGPLTIQKRMVLPFITIAMIVTAVLSFLFILTPIQAASSQAVVTPDSLAEMEYFSAFLGGNQEVPTANTDATGAARFSLDGLTLAYEVAVIDTTDITASHIHVGATGVNGPVVFPFD